MSSDITGPADQPVPPAQRRPGRRLRQVDLLADRLPEPRRVRLRRPHLPGQPARSRHPRAAHGDLLRADRRAGRRGLPDGARRPGRSTRWPTPPRPGIRNAVVLSSGYGEAGEAGPGRRGRAGRARRSPSAWCCSAPTTWDSPTSSTGCRSARSRACRARPARWRCCRRAAPVPPAMLDFAALAGVGLSYLVTLGNEAMITAGHVLDFLVDDPGTRAVAIFMETVRDPAVFRRAARRAAAAGKAIVALKAGSSALSARTAAAHTGALVGDDQVIDAVFADLGVIRVDSIEDMLITAGRRRRARPPRAAGHRHRVDLRRRLRHRGRPGRGSRRRAARAGRAHPRGARRRSCPPTAPCRTRSTSPARRSSTRRSSPGRSRRCPRDPSDRRRRRGQQAARGSTTAGPTSGRCSSTRSAPACRGRACPVGLRQPGHAADHRLHPGRDGARRRALRHPRPAPGRGRAAQRRLVVRRSPGAVPAEPGSGGARPRRLPRRPGRAARAVVGGRGPPAAGRAPASRVVPAGWPPRPTRRSRPPPDYRRPGRRQGCIARRSCTRATSAVCASTSPPDERRRSATRTRPSPRPRPPWTAPTSRARWSARCAAAGPSCWSAWSATRSGARCSPSPRRRPRRGAARLGARAAARQPAAGRAAARPAARPGRAGRRARRRRRPTSTRWRRSIARDRRPRPRPRR